jgi:hypothetical protein
MNSTGAPSESPNANPNKIACACFTVMNRLSHTSLT